MGERVGTDEGWFRVALLSAWNKNIAMDGVLG